MLPIPSSADLQGKFMHQITKKFPRAGNIEDLPDIDNLTTRGKLKSKVNQFTFDIQEYG